MTKLGAVKEDRHTRAGNWGTLCGLASAIRLCPEVGGDSRGSDRKLTAEE